MQNNTKENMNKKSKGEYYTKLLVTMGKRLHWK